MGQKVNPHGLRVGIIKGWESEWFGDTKKEFSENLASDYVVREFICKKYAKNAIANVKIERKRGQKSETVKVYIYTGRPAAMIGEKGANIEILKDELKKITKSNVIVNIIAIKKVETNATLVAQKIALDIEKRGSVKRAMRSAITAAQKQGVKGIRTMVSGRIDGAEIARAEKYHEGTIPLQTLRADIDYGVAEAETTYGIVGVKVWIYNGDIFSKNPFAQEGGRV